MKKIDPKSIGVPNICFSMTKPNDDREKAYSKQRIKYGFDDSETWSLADTIAKFIIPRLERYDEISNEATIRTAKEKKQIKDILKAMKLIVRDNGSRIYTKTEEMAVEKGLKTFSDIFMGLWW